MPVIARVGLPAITARRHYDEGSAEHLRLALILLDGAAEAILRRMVDDHQMWFMLGDRITALNLAIQAAGETEDLLPVHCMTFPSTAVGEAGQSTPVFLSNNQRNKLDREFGANVDVALYFRQVTPSEAQALRHLHEYRNGAYHRNELNEQSIREFVELYLRLVANLLRSIRPVMVRLYPLEDDESVRLMLGLDGAHMVSFSGVADAVSADLGADGGDDRAVLANNLGSRLTQVERRLQEVQQGLGVPWLTRADVTRLVQFNQPWPDDLEVVRATNKPVDEERLSSWVDGALAISHEPNYLRRFVAFASIDTPLAKFERQLEVVEMQLDREFQARVDELRGK